MENNQQIEITYSKSPRQTQVSKEIGVLAGLVAGGYAANFSAELIKPKGVCISGMEICPVPAWETPVEIGLIGGTTIFAGILVGVFSSRVAANLMGTTDTVVKQKTIDVPVDPKSQPHIVAP